MRMMIRAIKPADPEVKPAECEGRQVIMLEKVVLLAKVISMLRPCFPEFRDKSDQSRPGLLLLWS